MSKINIIFQIRDVCKILDITQGDFVVRSEEKSSTFRDSSKTSDNTSNEQSSKNEKSNNRSRSNDAKDEKSKTAEKKRKNRGGGGETREMKKGKKSGKIAYDEMCDVNDEFIQNIFEDDSCTFGADFSDSRQKDQVRF